jgi:hypothetical protein
MSSEIQSWRDALSNVIYAIFLTALMAATLFVIVGVNPKFENYGYQPWYYAGGCLLTTGAMYALSKYISK